MRQAAAAPRPDRGRLVESPPRRSIRALRCASLLALVCLLFGLSGSVAYAVPTDINPDTSDNANPNAASGGRVNHMAAVARQQRHLLPGQRVRRGVQDHRRRCQLDAPEQPPAGGRLGRRGRSRQHQPGRSRPPGTTGGSTRSRASRSAGRGRRRGRTPPPRGPTRRSRARRTDNTPAGWSCSATCPHRAVGFGISILGTHDRGRDELRSGTEHQQRRHMELRRSDPGHRGDPHLGRPRPAGRDHRCLR